LERIAKQDSGALADALTCVKAQVKGEAGGVLREQDCPVNKKPSSGV
jgi:hypothetical protein